MSWIRDLVAQTRASIVEVISTAAQGSGYVALPNGLIVTSLDVVGFERQVQIVCEGIGTTNAMVVRANVALDIALLMPTEPLGLPHLEGAPDPELGSEAAIVGRQNGEPMVIQRAVLSTSRVAEQLTHYWLDLPDENSLRGAPLLDANGGVLGLVTRPRTVRERGGRQLRRQMRGLVLPIAAFEGGLYSAEGAPEEVLTYAPEYGCPWCDTIFEPDMDRCLECGVMLPHRWVPAITGTETEEPPLKGLFAVKAALASMGISTNLARVGPRTWQFAPSFQDRTRDIGQTVVDLTVDEHGDHLLLRAPVVRLPQAGFEHLYRHLLTLNDESSGLMRLSVYDQTVYIALTHPSRSVDPGSFPSAVSELCVALARHRTLLSRDFGADPAYHHQLD